jgi:transcriptional regulator with XRE-family HTH domain
MARGRNRHGQWYQELGARIKAAIKDSGMAQGEIARRMGVTDGAVSRWTKGTAPEPDVLPRLARVLDVSGDYLLGLGPEKLPMAERRAEGGDAALPPKAARAVAEALRTLDDAQRASTAAMGELQRLLVAALGLPPAPVKKQGRKAG